MDLVALYNYMKRSYRHVGVSLFSQVVIVRIRGNVLKLCQGMFGMDIIKKTFTEMVLMHWNRLPREVIVLLPMEVFKKHVDMVCMDVV